MNIEIQGPTCPSCGRDNSEDGNICTADDCPGVERHTEYWRSGDRWSTIFGPNKGEPAPERIATVHGPLDVRKKRALLLAQAPQMYEALLNMLGAFDSPVRRLKFPGEFQDEAIKSARDAVAPIKGE